jgi:glycosyltransferase involved in cell wall biosynthesis
MAESSGKARVSIGMPVYNRESYVSEAIEAHLRQTYGDFELIITDNHSTDHTEEVCRAYAARDKRIKFFRNDQNLGAAGNFGRCFELSQGEYFRWHPSDDLVGPELLELCVEVLDKDPSVMTAYPRTRLIDASGNIISDYDENLHIMNERPSERFKEVLRRLRLCNLHYGLTRREKLAATGLLRHYPGGDIPMIAEMSLYGKFYEVPEHLFYRRMHEEASSAMKDVKDVMAFFDPKKKEKIFLRHWVHLGAHYRSVWRAPIPLGEKLNLSGYLLKEVRWSHKEYTGELSDAARQFLRRARHSS